jgi:hypothetical protein
MHTLMRTDSVISCGQLLAGVGWFFCVCQNQEQDDHSQEVGIQIRTKGGPFEGCLVSSRARLAIAFRAIQHSENFF